jgi:hypothetical protein
LSDRPLNPGQSLIDVRTHTGELALIEAAAYKTAAKGRRAGRWNAQPAFQARKEVKKIWKQTEPYPRG